jgi:hypothetical protein
LLKIEGKLGKAEELLRRVLEGSENSLPSRLVDVEGDGAFHSYTLEVVHAQADLLFEQGRTSKRARPGKFSEAATLYRRLLEDEYTQIAGSEAQIPATHEALRIASDLANMKRGPVDADLF